MSLFNDGDDDVSDSENNGKLVSDFKLKLRFDGEKGKKVIMNCITCIILTSVNQVINLELNYYSFILQLFHMQTSKATGDDRFVMDQRFFDEQETTEKFSDDEIEKQMNILEGVVGRSIMKPKKDNEDRM